MADSSKALEHETQASDGNRLVIENSNDWPRHLNYGSQKGTHPRSPDWSEEAGTHQGSPSKPHGNEYDGAFVSQRFKPCSTPGLKRTYYDPSTDGNQRGRKQQVFDRESWHAI